MRLKSPKAKAALMGPRGKRKYNRPHRPPVIRPIEHVLARRIKWLIDLIVLKPDGKRVFRYMGPKDSANGNGLYFEMAIPEDATPLEFLTALYRSPRAPMIMRLDAAKNAAQYVHAKLMAVKIVDHAKPVYEIVGGLPELPGTHTIMPSTGGMSRCTPEPDQQPLLDLFGDGDGDGDDVA
jgi:hypothetical protein